MAGSLLGRRSALRSALLTDMDGLARLVTRHARLVLWIWTLLLLLFLPLAIRAPSRLSPDPGSVTSSESAHVASLLKDRFGERDTNSLLLVTESAVDQRRPEVQRVYAQFLTGLAHVPGVVRVTRYDAAGTVRAINADGTLALTLAQIPAKDGAPETVLAVRRYTAGWTSPLMHVKVTGAQAVSADFAKLTETDSQQSELTALPLTAIVLLIVFGALVAVGLPLTMSLLSIVITLGALYFLTFLTPISSFAQSVVSILGLGAGIDYALLMVNRFREELLLDGQRQDAAFRTLQTAGRSVALSGLTMIIAMGALFIPPLNFVRSIGVGGVLVVLLSVLSSLTALPACFVVLGNWVNWPRLPALTWSQNPEASVVWTSIARRVLARPWLATCSGTAVLLILAAPTFQLRTGYAGAYGLTPGVESRDALMQVQSLGAGGLLSNFEVIFELGDVRYGPGQRGPFRAAVDRLRHLTGVQTVISPFVQKGDLTSDSAAVGSLATLNRRSVSTDHRLLHVTVLPDHYLRADQIDDFEARLRSAAQGAGWPVLIGGTPVRGREFTSAITDATPLAIGVVFTATFVLMLIAFRSIVIPIKSILMNSLTVGAACGVVVQVVQNGVLASPLGIPDDVGVLDGSLPLLLFSILFGLSMDYEIFLLSRVQEEHLRGASNDEAIVLAVGRTARIITSAAAIMVIVFSAFVLGRVVTSKSLGLGLAVAVLLDATLVRLVLVPAVLKLAGRWNWWLPRWLARLLPDLHAAP
jgi:RND superfamily putative drug exporter